MKKAAILVLVLAGCSSAPPPRPQGPTSGHLQPIEQGLTWTYISATGVRQTRMIVGEEKVGRFPCKIMEQRTGNVVEKRWLRAEKDGLKIYRIAEGGQNTDLQDAMVLIKYPAKAAESWEYFEHHGPVTLRVEGQYEADEETTVPAGTYKAARVKLRKSIQDTVVLEQTFWYAAGVGMVREKGVYRQSGKESPYALELESMSP